MSLSQRPVACFEPLETRALFAQSPYAGEIPLPGTIEVENFDKGGEGVAYHDTTSTNFGNGYRSSEHVDTQPGGSNGYNVGFTRPGEWLEYTVNVTSPGTFQIDTRVASGSSGGKFHIEVDGVNKTGSLSVGNTGGWSTYKTVSATGVSLAGGTHILRLAFDSSAKSGQDIGDFDSIKLIKTGAGTSDGGKFHPNALHWKTVATNPVRREEAQSLVYGGKVYSLGGYDDGYDALRRVDAYDPKTNKWTRKRDMPTAVNHAAVAPDPDGHSFWFIGGFKGNFSGSNHNGPDGKDKGPDATSDVYKYDAASDTWSKQKSLPNAQGAGGAGIVNGKLYFFGGADKDRKFDRKEGYVLDLKNTAAGWKRIADTPNPRNHLGGIAVNGKIYAIGGQDGLEEHSHAVRDVHRYDPATNTWTKVASMPASLSHFNAATVLYNRYIITVGGENPHDTPKASVYAYDTVLNKWASMTSLPSARRAGVAGIVGSKLIQSTGFNTQHTHVGTTYIADLSSVFA